MRHIVLLVILLLNIFQDLILELLFADITLAMIEKLD